MYATVNSATAPVSRALLGLGDEPLLATHLITPRALYTHHGIYVGNGRVIHYAGFAYGLQRGPVEEVSLERFAHGHSIWVRLDRRCFDRSEVVERVRSRLGERSYDVLTNNCEHLCAWALRDECLSSQVERLRALPQVICRIVCIQSRRLRGALMRWSASLLQRPISRERNESHGYRHQNRCLDTGAV